jgi:large subunit ribosomal protein L22
MGKPKAPRRLADNEAMAKGQRIRISWQKLNLVAQLIRGKKADQAVHMLQFSPKRIARDVKKVLESAIANAENNHGLDVDKLFVKEAHVGPALVMKRFKAKSKGRAGRIIKPFSNLTVVVHEPPAPAAAPAEAKEAA